MSRIVERNETVMEKIVNTEEKLCKKWMFRNLQSDSSLHSLQYQVHVLAGGVLVLQFPPAEGKDIPRVYTYIVHICMFIRRHICHKLYDIRV